MKQLLIVILVLVVLGCQSSGKPETPENLISKDKMVDILYDVFVLNAAKGSNKLMLEKNGIYPENYVFEKYGIDSLQFAESNAYYGFFVDDYEAIMADVDQRIQANKQKYQNIIDEEGRKKQREKDSIRKLNDSMKIKDAPEMKLPTNTDNL